MAAYGILIWALITAVLAPILILASHIYNARRNRKISVAFFHPYTNDGGGGERVLWCAVKAIQEESPDLDCIVYTGDHEASPDSLFVRAVDRFGVKLLYPPKVQSFLSFDCLCLVFCFICLFLIKVLFSLIDSCAQYLLIWLRSGGMGNLFIQTVDCIVYTIDGDDAFITWNDHFVFQTLPRVILGTCEGFSDIRWWENECRKNSNMLL